MVDDNGNWNWAKLVTLLPHSILLHLSAAKPPSPGFTRDIPSWAQSHDRAFTIRSAYELLDESNTLAPNGVWKVVSGFRGLQRIKSFLWLLAKDKLLTNVERVRCYITVNGRCDAYGASMESTHHLFRECQIVVAVWKGLIKPNKWVEFMSLKMLEWIPLNPVSPTYFAIVSDDWDLRFGAFRTVVGGYGRICEWRSSLNEIHILANSARLA
ncbi:hypothetical protein V6N11_022356 [Hibiscus sabdariffa]|uniref:Reverse transcriptase zinc-binding domain-containing protein n=1 Tax=Hibiscus sabdariffa TaxID=183260 RepID=A0ABR2TJH9_9ROSI